MGDEWLGQIFFHDPEGNVVEVHQERSAATPG